MISQTDEYPGASPEQLVAVYRLLESGVTPEAIKLMPLEQLTCEHGWHELTDASGKLLEPATDICVSCGAERR